MLLGYDLNQLGVFTVHILKYPFIDENHFTVTPFRALVDMAPRHLLINCYY